MDDGLEDSAKNKTIQYQLDILKQEIGSIEQIIARIDDVSQTIKNWTVVVWTGSIAVILGQAELRVFMGFIAIIPLLFWLADAKWGSHQTRLFLRSQQISEFLNDHRLYQSIKQQRLVDFIVYDPLARQSQNNPKFKKQLSYWHALWDDSTKLIFYLGLIIMSVGIGLFFWLHPTP